MTHILSLSYDLRFYAEDLGLVPADRKFRWKVLENPNFFKEERR